MILTTAVLFGLMGSLHCLGMCAPLLWAVPKNTEKKTEWWFRKIAYNAGRILTYAILGLVAGLLGYNLALKGWQSQISWITGVVLLLALMLSFWGHKVKPFKWFSLSFNRVVKRGMAFTLGKHSLKSQFFFGLFNGLLPCGLVYMALIASLSMASLGGGVLYMVLFGLGTVPMMIASAFFKEVVSSLKIVKFSRIYPKVVVLVAVILIVRGMNLGIPYLSPKTMEANSITVCKSSDSPLYDRQAMLKP